MSEIKLFNCKQLNIEIVRNPHMTMYMDQMCFHTILRRPTMYDGLVLLTIFRNHKKQLMNGLYVVLPYIAILIIMTDGLTL